MAFSAEALAGDLTRLGVRWGGVLMVHSSLSAIGQVDGGAAAVIQALRMGLGPEGTLVMPAFRASLCLPGLHRSLPEDVVRGAMQISPPDPDGVAPTSMGAIPETFRCTEGVRRSAHPTSAVTARGPKADEILEPHPLAYATGPSSPFARLHALDAQQLLLGVSFNRLTMLHYVENRVPHGRRKTRVVPLGDEIVLAGDVGDDMDVHFPEIGRQAIAAGIVHQGLVGEAPSVLMDSAAIVALAEAYLSHALLAPGDNA